MPRLVITDSTKTPLEVTDPTTRRKISPQEIERGLGAEYVGSIPPGGSPISAYALRQELFRRLRSTGGRPGLDGADIKPKITLQRPRWKQLERLAELIQINGLHPSPAQLAS